MTDHTDSNIWIKTINIWTGILEQLNYYIDTHVRELFLPVLRQFKSVAYLAELVDYRIKGRVSASVDLTFSITEALPEDFTLSKGIEVQSLSGIRFFTQEDAVLLAGETSVVIKAANKIYVTTATAAISNNGQDQKYELSEEIEDMNITVTIADVQWNKKESLAYSVVDSLDYVAGINGNGKMELRFGDGKNGALPPLGEEIKYTCYKTDGERGNLPSNTITKLITNITIETGEEFKVTNAFGSTGGSDIESVEVVRKNIPLSTRSLYKAVTEDDYRAVAEMASGVAKAGVYYDCGRTILIYISPNGSVNGIASSELLASTQAFMQERIMLTTRVNVKSAGIVSIKQVWNVKIKQGYFNNEQADLIKLALSNFLSINNQLIYGSVERGDLYQVVENLEGVESSRLITLITIPYARPVNHDLQLTWTRETTPESVETVKWSITKVASGYQLLKNGSYIGTYSWGVLNNQGIIIMTPQNNTSAINGSVWEFCTYKYNDNIELAEPSVPISEISDLTINVTGGI
jgi:hypothetical protein